MEQQKKYIKPAQFAEKEIIKEIIDGKWISGQKLPPERELSVLLGITRPTLREVLQRLSRDGWLTIKHGRPTTVNDYKNNGGLGVLKTLVKFSEFASKPLVKDWLEFRVLILPDLAYKAVLSKPDEILKILNKMPNLNSETQEFAIFDWDLQMVLIKYSGNSIARMVYNDLSELYHSQGVLYFDNEETKTKSLQYYTALKNAIQNNTEKVKAIVKFTMQESLKIWKKT